MLAHKFTPSQLMESQTSLISENRVKHVQSFVDLFPNNLFVKNTNNGGCVPLVHLLCDCGVGD